MGVFCMLPWNIPHPNWTKGFPLITTVEQLQLSGGDGYDYLLQWAMAGYKPNTNRNPKPNTPL